MLEIAELTAGYGHGASARAVLDRVSLRVGRGELAVITGPSGCGKSTLLRCVAGLGRPAAGTVTVDGTVTASGTRVHAVPSRMAVVFQDYSRSLYPWLSVRDNVALPLRRVRPGQDRPGRAARRAAAAQALAAVGLDGAADRYPWQLSGGMQQRVAIARAIACDPVLLLMDEPFGSVDPQAREDLQDLVLDLRSRRDLTILMVTHDLDEAVYLGDRIIVLAGTPARVAAELGVDLPGPRDQAGTRLLPEFARLRSQAGQLTRGQG